MDENNTPPIYAAAIDPDGNLHVAHIAGGDCPRCASSDDGPITGIGISNPQFRTEYDRIFNGNNTVDKLKQELFS